MEAYNAAAAVRSRSSSFATDRRGSSPRGSPRSGRGTSLSPSSGPARTPPSLAKAKRRASFVESMLSVEGGDEGAQGRGLAQGLVIMHSDEDRLRDLSTAVEDTKPDCRVRGCSTVREAIQAVDHCELQGALLEARPDSTDVVGFLKHVKRHCTRPPPTMMILSSGAEEAKEHLESALEIGALGFFPSSASPAQVADRLVSAAQRFALVHKTYSTQIAERDFRLKAPSRRAGEQEAPTPAADTPAMTPGPERSSRCRRAPRITSEASLSPQHRSLTPSKSAVELLGVGGKRLGSATAWKDLPARQRTRPGLLSNLLNLPVKRPSLSFLPRHSRVRTLLSRAFDRHSVGDAEGAWKDVNLAVQASSRCAECFLSRGVIAFMEGAMETAYRDFTHAYTIEPQGAGTLALFNRAQCDAQLGDVVAAKKDLETALELGPDTVPIARLRAHIENNLALIDRATGNYPSSREHYGRMYEVLDEAERREAEQSGGGGGKLRAGGDAGGEALRRRGGPATAGTSSSPGAEGSGDGKCTPAARSRARPSRGTGLRKVRVMKGIGESESDYGAEDEVSRQSRRSTIATFGPQMLALSRAAARAEGTEEDAEEEGEEDEEGEKARPARKAAGADARAEGGAKSISVLLLEQEKEEEKRIIELLVEMLPESIRKEMDDDHDGDVSLSEFGAHAPAATKQVLKRIRRQPPEVRIALLRRPRERSKQDLVALMYLMRTVPYFWKFPHDIQHSFCQCLVYKVCDAGMDICRQGDPVDNFYVIVSGRCAVKVRESGGSQQEITVNALGQGEYFGELGFVQRGGRRKASVVATEPTELLAIPFSEFQDTGLCDFFKRDLDQKAEALDDTGAFEDWPLQTVAALASVSRVRSFSRGEVLLRQGQVADQFFVMLKGMVTVRKSVDPAQELREEASHVAHQLEQLREGYVYHRRLRPSLAAHMGSVESLQVLAADPPEGRGAALSSRQRAERGGRGASGKGLPPLGEASSGGAGSAASLRSTDVTPLTQSGGPDTESKGERRMKVLESELKELRRRIRAAEREGRMKGGRLEVEVSKLYPPQIFGETALLDPWKGQSRGTVVAETWVQCLAFSKKQVDHTALSPAMLKSVEQRVVLYPKDAKLKERQAELQEWKAARKKVVQLADKRRWPVPQGWEVPAPGGGSFIAPKRRVGPPFR